MTIFDPMALFSFKLGAGELKEKALGPRLDFSRFSSSQCARSTSICLSIFKLFINLSLIFCSIIPHVSPTCSTTPSFLFDVVCLQYQLTFLYVVSNNLSSVSSLFFFRSCTSYIIPSTLRDKFLFIWLNQHFIRYRRRLWIIFSNIFSHLFWSFPCLCHTTCLWCGTFVVASCFLHIFIM